MGHVCSFIRLSAMFVVLSRRTSLDRIWRDGFPVVSEYLSGSSLPPP